MEHNFEDIRTRLEIGRTGGIEIDLTGYGYEGERMSAFYNYLGGDMVGKIITDNTVWNRQSPFVDESTAKELNQISVELKKYLYSLMYNGFDTRGYLKNQCMPVSAY